MFKENVCKQCKQVKCKETMTKWPVQKQAYKNNTKNAVLPIWYGQ